MSSGRTASSMKPRLPPSRSLIVSTPKQHSFKKVSWTSIMFSLRRPLYVHNSYYHVTEGNIDQSQNQLSPTTKKIVEDGFPNALIPPLAAHLSQSFQQVELHNDQFQVPLQDKKFTMAQEVAHAAEKIVAAKETRWAALIKNVLFSKLIKLARAAEGHTRLKAAQVLETIRVYAPPRHGQSTIPRTDRYRALYLTFLTGKMKISGIKAERRSRRRPPRLLNFPKFRNLISMLRFQSLP